MRPMRPIAHRGTTSHAPRAMTGRGICANPRICLSDKDGCQHGDRRRFVRLAPCGSGSRSMAAADWARARVGVLPTSGLTARMMRRETIDDTCLLAHTGSMQPSFGEATAQSAQRWVRWFAASSLGAWLFARVLHRVDRVAFHLTGGHRTVTSTLSGLPVVMLTTTGARTGTPRTVLVLAIPIGDATAVAAGNFGRVQDPGWCLNLRQEPRVQIVVDGELRHVVAEELTGAARERAW